MDEGFNLPSKYHDTVYFKLPLAIPVSLLSYHLASLHRCWKMLLDLSVDTCQHWNDCYIQIIFIICWNCPCTVSYLFLLFHVACFFWHAVPMMFFFYLRQFFVSVEIWIGVIFFISTFLDLFLKKRSCTSVTWQTPNCSACCCLLCMRVCDFMKTCRWVNDILVFLCVEVKMRSRFE